MVVYATSLATYHGDAYTNARTLQHLDIFGWLLIRFALAFLFVAIIALCVRIVRARTGTAPSWPLYAAYAWAGSLAALDIARYGISAYTVEAYDDMMWGFNEDINYTVINNGVRLAGAIVVLQFVTALVACIASIWTVARHRISTTVSTFVESPAKRFPSSSSFMSLTGATPVLCRTADLCRFVPMRHNLRSGDLHHERDWCLAW
jgi:hypothetical protein